MLCCFAYPAVFWCHVLVLSSYAIVSVCCVMSSSLLFVICAYLCRSHGVSCCVRGSATVFAHCVVACWCSYGVFLLCLDIRGSCKLFVMESRLDLMTL